MKLRCRIFGCKPKLVLGEGKKFVRNGNVYEFKPDGPCKVICQRCERRMQ